MIRYNLDDLGWFQFEWLTQALLKAELGLGVEAWGGRHDYGRDAYSNGPLNFPAKHLTNDGPFLFQVKFAENANGAGARPESAIQDSVKKEIASIKRRVSENKWEQIKHYALFTNAPLSANLKKDLESTLKESLPHVDIHLFGGKDVCDLLDAHPALRRSFPQLLSLRDLDYLLQEVVNKETIEKSRSAIECARDVVAVFAPTKPYEKAWVVLRKHYFVVLEGPPEMGKTAIAWMIALAQLSQGWQAIVCDGPEDFFRSYEADSNQVFVADDAFGRTEYDPSRTSKWEMQLERVLRRVDTKHWLIWTSRKHILERAKKRMDLQGHASAFPNPGAVLVNASSLSMEDKALILYRHARAAGLEEKAKALIKKQAKFIISDTSFTPERIRRFINEVLPELQEHLGQDGNSELNVLSEIREAIQNPTDRMRKSFKALPVAHKWLLIALLEAGHSSRLETLRKLYEKSCPVEHMQPFDEVLDELTEAFVKKRNISLPASIVSRLHKD